MKLLLTGFEPFGGGTDNPSWDCLEYLACPENIDLVKLRLPVTFRGAPAMLREALEAERPDAVVCLGLAENRQAITPELIAVNLAHGRIADNEGFQPSQEPVIPGGPDGRFATLPVFALVEALQGAGLPAQVSYTAGAYVCNTLMYHLLDWAKDKHVPAGFVHIPSRQTLPLPETARGIGCILQYLAEAQKA